MTAYQDRTEICCVALPILRGDLAENLSNLFQLWADPRYTPVTTPTTHRPVLMVVLNQMVPADEARIRALYAAFPVLQDSFARLVVFNANLSGDRDLYARGADEAMGSYGNKAGPNFLFQRTMERAAHFQGFTLQIELDCLPTGADWMTAANRVVAGNARAWVIGSLYAGAHGLGPEVQMHLNGNAIYKTGDPHFMRFLQTVWMPRLLRQAKAMPNLAYDCWWAWETASADAWLGNDAWHLLQTYESFFRNDPFIVNLLVKEDGLQDFSNIYARFVPLGRRAVFFHGQPMMRLLRTLLQHPAHSVFDSINLITGRSGAPRRHIPESAAPPTLSLGAVGPVITARAGLHPVQNAALGDLAGAWASGPQVQISTADATGQIRYHWPHPLPDSARHPTLRLTCEAHPHMRVAHSWDSFSQRGTLSFHASDATGPLTLTLHSDTAQNAAPGTGLLLVADGVQVVAQ